MIWEIVNQPQWNIPDFGKLFFFSLSLRGKQVIELREREVALSSCHLLTPQVIFHRGFSAHGIHQVTGKTIYELICPQFLKRNPHFTVGYIVRKNLQAEINTINDKNTLSNNRISKLKFTICDKEFSIINMHVNKYTIDIPVGNENTILLGDMNACTENQATDNKAINVKFLKRIKNKGWIEVESNEPIYTWKSNGIEKKLDHIYIYKDLDNQQSIVTSAEPAVNFYYNQSGFTDHTMLVIEFPVININSSLQR